MKIKQQIENLQNGENNSLKTVRLQLEDVKERSNPSFYESYLVEYYNLLKECLYEEWKRTKFESLLLDEELSKEFESRLEQELSYLKEASQKKKGGKK